jgi:uncharacterized membrane protein YwzB
MKKIQILIFSFCFLSLIITPVMAQVLTPDKVNDFNNTLNSFSGELTEEAGYDTERDLATIIGQVTQMILALLGSVFLIYLFVAGNQWMQAAGNEEKIKKSKARIQSLIIGLIVVLIAFALSNGFSGLLANMLTTNK